MMNTQTIKKTLLKWPKKTIYLKELAGIIGTGKTGDYQRFYSDVQTLVQEGFLTPMAASGSNGMNPPLENRYRVNLHNLPGIDALKVELLKLHVALKIAYYQNHLDEYIKDREIVHTFNDYFSSRAAYPKIERRELSFLLFQQEKALDPSTHAYKVLSRLGLNLQRDFNCFDRRLPVTYFPFAKTVKNVLIVENLTPFYDLFLIFRQLTEQSKGLESSNPDLFKGPSGEVTSQKRQRFKENSPEIVPQKPQRFKEHSSQFVPQVPWRFEEHVPEFALPIPFHSLALGNGNHIVSAFEFFEDLFDEASQIDYYYWGDVDGAGLTIYLSLKKKYPNYRITLWETAYEKMLQTGQWREDSSKWIERPDVAHEPFINHLLDVVAQAKAIPQEVLTLSNLEALIHGE